MQTMQQLTIVFLYTAMMIPFSHANNMNQSHKVSIEEAQAAMRDASNNATRLAELRGSLDPYYEVVPKNEHGRLDHQTVRYVLHRFFHQRHGWFIKGLASNETQSWHVGSSSKVEDPKIKEWVPSFLEDQLEQGPTSHTGTDLDGLAVLAVTLEQLVRNELHDRLKMVYSMHGWEVRPLSVSEAHDLIHTYFLSFLLAGKWEWTSPQQVVVKELRFAARYPSYNATMAWMDELELKHRMEMGEKAFGSLESMEKLALKIGEEYFGYANSDCQGMKHTLIGMEGKKAGRVRLSTFYGKSLYGGFKFNERREYLQALGAIDDSDPATPQVIISNYVLGRPNCLEASAIYAVCCSNECEDLVSRIESHFQSSFAEPKDIVNLVSTFDTDTQAPSVFETDLVLRLQKVADQNNGKVPLHGRLFSQWLHHAFPRECPYPQKAGSASPLTPWDFESSSQGDSEASQEEMQKTIDDAVCEVDSQGKLKGPCDEDASLPWSDEEELLGSYVASKPSSTKRRGLAMAFFMAVGQILLVVLFLEYRHARTANQVDVMYLEKVSKSALESKFQDLKKASLLWVLCCVLWAIDFLDAWVFACGACSYIFILAARLLCRKLA